MSVEPLRYIPINKNDIFELCLNEAPSQLSNTEFTQFYQLLSHTFHFEFYKIKEGLKASFESDGTQFVELLNGLLNKANYERISQQDLNNAMNEASLFKIKLDVDFNDFDEVLLYCRGESIKTETIKTWFGLRQITIQFRHYDRVVVYLKSSKTLELASPSLKDESNGILLKLFQNVPKADLEMLFPNTQVRMRLSDKLFIGIPALISGGIVISTKLGASLLVIISLASYWFGATQQEVSISKAEILALLAGLGALAGYLWKQYSNFKNRKLRFLQSLTQNLYFKNLDNSEGVFHRLIDEAEEEEVKEALLAYYFLIQNQQGLSKADLDKTIEQWILKKKNCKLNFEIDDALNKLLVLNLVTEKEGILQAASLSDALTNLDKRWDDYFKISK